MSKIGCYWKSSFGKSPVQSRACRTFILTFSHRTHGGIWLCYRYVTSAFEASATRQRKNRPPVGLEVRKATRDISRGLDSANIYADSARGNEYFDVTLFMGPMGILSYYIIIIIIILIYFIFHFSYIFCRSINCLYAYSGNVSYKRMQSCGIIVN